MQKYKPAKIGELNKAAYYHKAVYIQDIGIEKKIPEEEGRLILVNVTEFSSNEQVIDDVLTILENITMVMYQTQIESSGYFKIDDILYEIVGEPQKIDYRFLKVKIRRVKGGI